MKKQDENNLKDKRSNLHEDETTNSDTDKSQEKSEIEMKENYEVRIDELENQVKEWQEKLLRKAAEFENYKRRTENDQFNLINYAAESFIIKLLPIVDDFERSMLHIDEIDDSNSVKEGIRLMYEKLQRILNEQGVKKMQTKGQPFNVDYHDALMQRKDDSVPPHTVLEEIEPGYLYRDKVIRHAKVIVSEDSSFDENQFSNDDSFDSNSENEK